MPNKKAFLVGINNYANPKYALRGCLNDVDSFGDVLTQRFGFVSENIRTLKDQNCTRANILAGLKDLLSGAGAGDVLVFGYSGHGCQKPTSAPGTQPNDMNDALVPYEATYPSLITDEELFNIITRVITSPTIKFTAIYDCCHSGTMIRDVGFDLNSGELVSFVENRCLFIPDLENIQKRAVAIGPYNVFSACGDLETAADVLDVPDEHRPRGAFSYAIHKLMRNGANSATDLDANAGAIIRSISKHTQNPSFFAVDPNAPLLA